MSTPHRYVIQRQVRFGDCDMLGHVNNVRFFDYLEDVRIAMLFNDPGMADRPRDHGLVVARHEIDYRNALNFRPQPVRVETWVTEISGAKFRLAYEIRDEEILYAQAASVMVAFDSAAGRTRRLSEDEIAYLKRFA